MRLTELDAASKRAEADLKDIIRVLEKDLRDHGAFMAAIRRVRNSMPIQA